MRSVRAAITIAMVGVLALSAVTAGATFDVAYAPPASTDATVAGAEVDTDSAMVVLKGDPLATYDGKLRGYEKTRPDNGKLNPNSAAAKKYVGYLKNQHDAFQAWLRKNVPSAKVTSEYFTVMNAVAVSLHGAAIGKLANNSDVVVVQYQARYQPTMTQSLDIIKAAGAWTSGGGRAGAGRGIKVAVVDSGIDYRHPFFDPAGFSAPAGFPKCDAMNAKRGGGCKYTTGKVIVARSYTNKENQNGFDAMPISGEGDHGTHVAGTIGGVVMAAPTINGVAIAGTMSGVAPGVWLGNYNVFPGDIESARDEDILSAVEDAVEDGMDVMNLSLGGGYRGNNDLLAMGLDNAVAAGVTVVASAGNNGPGGYTIGSPGRARDIITAGASTNQHYVGQPITYGGSTIGAAVSDFPALSEGTYSIVDTNSTACGATGLPDLTGKLAIVNRGTCVFSAKVASAKAKGAVAVIVVNNVAGDPSAMGRTAGYNDGIPAVMVASSERGEGKLTDATTATASTELSEFLSPENADILAGFSSQGPTFVDEAIKPDLTSVGVNVLSSVVCPGSGATCTDPQWDFYNGTSMSAPHLAGSAAVLLGLHPDWSPAEVKSALVNTADPVVRNAKNGTSADGPMAQGSGRENLTAAAGATVTLSPVSASFGKISGSRVQPTSFTITLTNHSGSAQLFNLAAKGFVPSANATIRAYGGGSLSMGDGRIVYPSAVEIPANGSRTIEIAVKAGLPLGSIVQGWIFLTGTSGTYHFAYWASVAP